MTRRRQKQKPAEPAAGARAAADEGARGGTTRSQADRWDGLWLGSFLLLVFLVGCVEIDDDDIWWHLRTGQLIAQRREIPRTDWFTYTNPDSPWIDLHWGFQLIAAGLWAVGGAPALVLTKSLLGTATFALCLACRGPRQPWRQVVACWLPSILIFSGRNQVRPEMFSFLFLAAVLAVLFHQRRRPWLVWLLPLIQAIWINLHALFILGLIVWFCFLADAAARRLIARGDDPKPNAADFRRWAGVTVLSLAAALANPYGLEGALFPFTLLKRIQGEQRGFYQQFADEFYGLGDFIGKHGLTGALTNVTTCMMLLLAVLIAATFFWRFARGRWALFPVLLFTAFAYLAWQASRNSPLFALAGGFVFQTNVDELCPVRFAIDTRRFRPGLVLLGACLGLLIAAVPTDIFWMLAHGEMPRRFGWGEVPYMFPHESARFLAREGMPRHIYAVDQGAAAVCIFHDGPERRVFADGRLEVNTRETLDRYDNIWNRELTVHSGAAIDELRRDVEPGPDGTREVPAVMVDIASSLALFDDPRFRPVFFDDVAYVFLTTDQADRLGLEPVPLTQRAVMLHHLRLNHRRIEVDSPD
jgi:hypothetical protein